MSLLKIYLAPALATAFFVYGSYIRFSNPSLTETQLLLEYWWFWLAGGLTIIGAAKWGMK